MASRDARANDGKSRQRAQRVTDNDRALVKSVVKHAGLKRCAPDYQEYVVRGVNIDAEGVKRYCLHEVAAMPDFDDSRAPGSTIRSWRTCRRSSGPR